MVRHGRPANIRDSTDVLDLAGGNDVLVRIEIWVEEAEPFTGRATRREAEPVPFVGWLGLLRALSALLEGDGALSELPDRGGRELGAVGNLKLGE